MTVQPKMTIQPADVRRHRPIRWFFLLLMGAAFALGGCMTSETDNLTERPWNTPKSWENGLPAGMTEGR